MILPNKELLREVLGLDFIPKKIETQLGYIRYCEANKINIHELGNKCKEWAIQEDIKLLQIDVVLKNNYRAIVYDDNGEHCFISSNEPEAVFKACEYILNNKEK